MTNEYQEIQTNVPPVLTVEDGRLFIKLMAGNLTLVAPVGNGQFFFSQIVDKLVDPALLLRQQLLDADALSSQPRSDLFSGDTHCLNFDGTTSCNAKPGDTLLRDALKGVIEYTVMEPIPAGNVPWFENTGERREAYAKPPIASAND